MSTEEGSMDVDESGTETGDDTPVRKDDDEEISDLSQKEVDGSRNAKAVDGVNVEKPSSDNDRQSEAKKIHYDKDKSTSHDEDKDQQAKSISGGDKDQQGKGTSNDDKDQQDKDPSDDDRDQGEGTSDDDKDQQDKDPSDDRDQGEGTSDGDKDKHDKDTTEDDNDHRAKDTCSDSRKDQLDDEDISADNDHQDKDFFADDKDLQEKDTFINKESIIEEALPEIDSKMKPKQSLLSSIPKDVSTFRMQLSKEDIERMISGGTLEKVSDGYYKVKPESLKDLKTTSTSVPKDFKITKHNIQEKTVIQIASAPTAITLQSSSTQVSGTAVVQQPSFVALMPVNQLPGAASNNAFVALPIQQNAPITYNPTIPTFVALTQSGIAVPSTTPQIVTQETARRTTISTGVDKINIVETPLVKQKEPMPEESTSSSLLPAFKPKVVARETKNIPSTPAPFLQKTTIGASPTGVKRKPQIESTKVQKPYRFAKPLRKRRRTSKLKDFVSDLNSSDEEDEVGLDKSKSYSTELASMFFKKIGEPKTNNKSLLDKLHKAIFNDTNLESDEDSEDSNVEDVISDIKSGKANYQTINCPGPGQYEALIGPANNSKLSIIRCQETKQVKNFLYEIYKVRVTSAGREANTNILIPIPDGYKFQIPLKSKEEQVEFSHIPHEDPESNNYVNPLFLEKLTETELKLRKCKDEIKVLRGRYLELLQEYSNRPQFSTLSDLVGASAKFLTEDQLVFFLMQLKAGAHNMQGIRYSVREKVLALSIYQKSPEVYKWLRKLFNLPSKRTLDQWLEEIGSQDPQLLKKLMYHIYTTYNFKADI